MNSFYLFNYPPLTVCLAKEDMVTVKDTPWAGCGEVSGHLNNRHRGEQSSLNTSYCTRERISPQRVFLFVFTHFFSSMFAGTAHVDVVWLRNETSVRQSARLEGDSDGAGLMSDRPAPAATCFMCVCWWPVHLLYFPPPWQPTRWEGE